MISRVKDMSAYLKQVAKFLNIPPIKINFTEAGTCYITKHDERIMGVLNVINEYLKESDSTLGGKTFEERVLVRQWIEYAIVYAVVPDNSIFNMLNESLSRKTYLIGHHLTICDIVLYYIIQNKMENLTYLEKEKYINVCRWFDNLQQDSRIRQSNKEVDFKTVHLANLVPVRH